MVNKLGVIVPYRDRHKHLTIFKTRIQRHLEKTLDGKFTIIVVGQDNASPFNRGMLCNIGFLEAVKQRCNYVVFHDVDMLPQKIDYSYSDTPVHLASTKDNPAVFDSYFGGITLFPKEIFKKINGFSNLYWGWGFEDDDLRYRCIRHNIPFASFEKPTNIGKNSTIFNGVDAYATIPNILNFSRDFEIEINLRLDRVTYNPESQRDSFPILTITGYDMVLEYNSFNRFKFNIFDRNGEYYDITSSITTKSKNKIILKYIKKELKLELIVNNLKQGEISLKTSPHNYGKERIITFGANNLKTEFFKGAIDQIKITSSNKLLADYTSDENGKYRLQDISGNNHHGKVYNVYFDNFIPPVNYYSYIPFRRESKITFLRHDNNGFNEGVWKDSLTRWNQLRYNNEVQNGGHDNLEDGLSTCKFKQHGKLRDGNITYLSVGI